MVKKSRYSAESLKTVFGTERPSDSAVRRWRLSWRENEYKVGISSFAECVRVLSEHNVDTLYYQFWSVPPQKFVTFYRDEDYVFFKMYF